MAATTAEVSAICGRFALHLEDLMLVGRPGGSVFVARVRDRAGVIRMLKRTRPETSVQEMATLRAWSDSGVTPRLIAELEPGLCLAEWFEGVALHEASDPATSAVEVGRAIRILQASADPLPECFDTRELIAASRHADHLSAPLRGLRARLADELLGRHPTRDVLLHGDLVPANVVVTSAGPRLIDPIGRRGLPAFDFGQLAAAAEGRGVRRLLPALLEGYGERPALIDEIAAWEVLVYLDKNLSVPDSPAVPRLLPLAEALLELDDPARFVALHLT